MIMTKMMFVLLILFFSKLAFSTSTDESSYVKNPFIKPSKISSSRNACPPGLYLWVDHDRETNPVDEANTQSRIFLSEEQVKEVIKKKVVVRQRGRSPGNRTVGVGENHFFTSAEKLFDGEQLLRRKEISGPLYNDVKKHEQSQSTNYGEDDSRTLQVECSEEPPENTLCDGQMGLYFADERNLRTQNRSSLDHYPPARRKNTEKFNDIQFSSCKDRASSRRVERRKMNEDDDLGDYRQQHDHAEGNHGHRFRKVLNSPRRKVADRNKRKMTPVFIEHLMIPFIEHPKDVLLIPKSHKNLNPYAWYNSNHVLAINAMKNTEDEHRDHDLSKDEEIISGPENKECNGLRKVEDVDDGKEEEEEFSGGDKNAERNYTSACGKGRIKDISACGKERKDILMSGCQDNDYRITDEQDDEQDNDYRITDEQNKNNGRLYDEDDDGRSQKQGLCEGDGRPQKQDSGLYNDEDDDDQPQKQDSSYFSCDASSRGYATAKDGGKSSCEEGQDHFSDAKSCSSDFFGEDNNKTSKKGPLLSLYDLFELERQGMEKEDQYSDNTNRILMFESACKTPTSINEEDVHSFGGSPTYSSGINSPQKSYTPQKVYENHKYHASSGANSPKKSSWDQQHNYRSTKGYDENKDKDRYKDKYDEQTLLYRAQREAGFVDPRGQEIFEVPLVNCDNDEDYKKRMILRQRDVMNEDYYYNYRTDKSDEDRFYAEEIASCAPCAYGYSSACAAAPPPSSSSSSSRMKRGAVTKEFNHPSERRNPRGRILGTGSASSSSAASSSSQNNGPRRWTSTYYNRGWRECKDHNSPECSCGHMVFDPSTTTKTSWTETLPYIPYGNSYNQKGNKKNYNKTNNNDNEMKNTTTSSPSNKSRKPPVPQHNVARRNERKDNSKKKTWFVKNKNPHQQSGSGSQEEQDELRQSGSGSLGEPSCNNDGYQDVLGEPSWNDGYNEGRFYDHFGGDGQGIPDYSHFEYYDHFGSGLQLRSSNNQSSGSSSSSANGDDRKKPCDSADHTSDRRKKNDENNACAELMLKKKKTSEKKEQMPLLKKHLLEDVFEMEACFDESSSDSSDGKDRTPRLSPRGVHEESRIVAIDPLNDSFRSLQEQQLAVPSFSCSDIVPSIGNKKSKEDEDQFSALDTTVDHDDRSGSASSSVLTSSCATLGEQDEVDINNNTIKTTDRRDPDDDKGKEDDAPLPPVYFVTTKHPLRDGEYIAGQLYETQGRRNFFPRMAGQKKQNLMCLDGALFALWDDFSLSKFRMVDEMVYVNEEGTYELLKQDRIISRETAQHHRFSSMTSSKTDHNFQKTQFPKNTVLEDSFQKAPTAEILTQTRTSFHPIRPYPSSRFFQDGRNWKLSSAQNVASKDVWLSRGFIEEVIDFFFVKYFAWDIDKSSKVSHEEAQMFVNGHLMNTSINGAPNVNKIFGNLELTMGGPMNFLRVIQRGAVEIPKLDFSRVTVGYQSEDEEDHTGDERSKIKSKIKARALADSSDASGSSRTNSSGDERNKQLHNKMMKSSHANMVRVPSGQNPQTGNEAQDDGRGCPFGIRVRVVFFFLLFLVLVCGILKLGEDEEISDCGSPRSEIIGGGGHCYNDHDDDDLQSVFSLGAWFADHHPRARRLRSSDMIVEVDGGNFLVPCSPVRRAYDLNSEIGAGRTPATVL